jgi:UDP-N-acetylmuramate dehydrogenase
MQLTENGDLRHLNSFGVAVRARYLAQLRDAGELHALLALRERHQLPLLILGGGTNILFRKDFDGIVARVQLMGIEVLDQDNKHTLVRAAAGEDWHGLVRHTLGADLGGLENLSCIPGTVGAAPMQNIGAYGVELSERFHSLQAMCLESGAIRTFEQAACGFGYRNSVFKGALRGRYLITAVTLALPKKPDLVLGYRGVSETLRKMGVSKPDPVTVSRAICHIRGRKLPSPTQLGNAGSFFKNPLVNAATLAGLLCRHPDLPSWPQGEEGFKLSAAWLIERCGWKGHRRGDAGVYHDHALVLVNHGNARGEQIWALAKDIRASVQEMFGVVLEPEPLIL